jgi:hypothetical protein
MDADDRGQPVVVDLAGCRCPGSPHHHDTVTLRAEPSVPMGQAAWAVASFGGAVWDVQARLAEVWLHYGIIDWTFVDEQKKPIPIIPTNIDRLLDFTHGGMEVAEKADELYSDVVIAPFVARMSRSSPPTSTADSTSPSPSSDSTRTDLPSGSGERPEVPSMPSSPTDSADGIASEVLVP